MIHRIIHQLSITTSEILHHFLHKNDTETEPGDDGDDNSIHSGGCFIHGAVDGGIWDKSTKFEVVHK